MFYPHAVASLFGTLCVLLVRAANLTGYGALTTDYGLQGVTYSDRMPTH